MLNIFLKQMQPYSIAFRDVQQQQQTNSNNWAIFNLVVYWFIWD
jgi:hypothetical protein